MTTGNQVRYSFSASEENYPVQELSDIFAVVRNRDQTAFTTINVPLSLSVLPCEVQASNLLCTADKTSLTLWTGQSATVSYSFSWDQTTCPYSYTKQVSYSDSSTLPNMVTQQDSELTFSPQAATDEGMYDFSIDAVVTYAETQPQMSPCLVNLVVHDCEKATYQIDSSTSYRITVQMFQTFDWVVKVVSDAGTNCGDLSINLLSQEGQDLYIDGSQSVVTGKIQSEYDSVTYSFRVAETDELITVENIQIQVKNSHQSSYTTLTTGLSYTIVACDVSTTSLICSPNTQSNFYMSLDDIETFDYNLVWNQGECNYTQTVFVVDTYTDNENLPSMFNKQTNSIRISPIHSSEIGTYQIDVTGDATYATIKPAVVPCTLNVRVYNCFISQMVYTSDDSNGLSLLSIELYQKNTFTLTEYVQVKQGGGTCNENVEYMISLPSFVTFDQESLQLSFSPSQLDQRGQHSMNVRYEVQGYTEQPPSSPADEQQLTFTVKECEIETLVYNPTSNFQIDGGTATVISFENYTQKHPTGNNCQYPIVYQAFFCLSESCEWQELPQWIDFQSASLTFTLSPAFTGDYGFYRLQIRATIPDLVAQPKLTPPYNQVIQVQVKCSQKVLSTLIYESNPTLESVTQYLGQAQRAIQFGQFQNLHNAQCGSQFAYEIQVFKSGTLMDELPSFITFNQTSLQLSSSAESLEYVGNYLVRLIPKYQLDQNQDIISFPIVEVELIIKDQIFNFQPGAYFTEDLPEVQVEDGSSKTLTLPQVECFEVDPCKYRITANLPSFMTFSENQTSILIQPLNVSNAAVYQTTLVLTLKTIKDDQIVSEKTLKLKVTISKPVNRTSQPNSNKNNSTFVGFAFNDSSQRNATSQQKKDFLVPSVSPISYFGNFKIEFNRDVITTAPKDLKVSQYLFMEMERGDYIYSAPLEFLVYDVRVVDFQARFLELQVLFNYPLNISIGFSQDRLKISLQNSNFTAVDGTKISQDYFKPVYLKIPKQIEQGLAGVVATAGSSIQGSLSSIFTLQLVGSIFMTVSLKSMWQLMNICQIFCMTGQLFLLPGMAEQLIEYLISIIDLKFIPLDWAKKILDNKGETTLSKLFDQRMVVLAISIAIIATITGGFHLVSKRIDNKTFSRVVEKVKQKLFFNAFLRYIVTAYLKLFVTGVQMVQTVDNQPPFQSLARVLFLALLAFIPTAILSLLQSNLPHLNEARLRSRIGSLYLGVKMEQLAMSYTTVFCYRRMVLALILLVPIRTGLVLPLLYGQQIAYMAYLLVVKPSEANFQNNLEIVGEACILFTFYVANFFGVQVSLDNQILGSYIFCSFLALTILAHISLLVVDTLLNFKKIWQMRQAKKRQAAQAAKAQRRHKLKSIREEMIRQRQELVVDDSTPVRINLIQVEDVDVQPLQNNYFQPSGFSNLVREFSPHEQEAYQQAPNSVDLELQNLEYSMDVSFDGCNSHRKQTDSHKMRQFQDYFNESFQVEPPRQTPFLLQFFVEDEPETRRLDLNLYEDKSFLHQDSQVDQLEEFDDEELQSGTQYITCDSNLQHQLNSTICPRDLDKQSTSSSNLPKHQTSDHSKDHPPTNYSEKVSSLAARIQAMRRHQQENDVELSPLF